MSGDRAYCPDIVVIDRYGSDRYPCVYYGRLGITFPSLIIDLVPGLLLPYRIIKLLHARTSLARVPPSTQLKLLYFALALPLLLSPYGGSSIHAHRPQRPAVLD